MRCISEMRREMRRMLLLVVLRLSRKRMPPVVPTTRRTSESDTRRFKFLRVRVAVLRSTRRHRHCGECHTATHRDTNHTIPPSRANCLRLTAAASALLPGPV